MRRTLVSWSPEDTFQHVNLTELELLRLGLWQAVSPPATSLAECCAHVKEAWEANKAPRFNIKLPPRYNDAYHVAGDGVAVPVVRHLAAEILEPLAQAARRTDAAAIAAE